MAKVRYPELGLRGTGHNWRGNKMKIPTLFAGGFLLLSLMPPGWSARVYSWTDAEGIFHFSETPPDDAQLEVTVREIEPAPVTDAPTGDDYYSVANQAARMEARRLEMEQIRAEILKAEAEARQANADAAAATREQAGEPAEDHASRYYPLYPWYPAYGTRPYPGYREHPRYPPHRVRLPDFNRKIVVPPHKP
jgi:hypothetical protein